MFGLGLVFVCLFRFSIACVFFSGLAYTILCFLGVQRLVCVYVLA